MSAPPSLQPWPGKVVSSPRDALVSLGHIVKPHGHNGAVKLFPSFDDPANLRRLPEPVILVSPPTARLKPETYLEMHLGEYFPHQNFIVVQIDEIDSMTTAERFRSAEVFVREENLWPLPPGEFFAYQLQGFDVYDLVSNRSIGSLVDIHTLAAHELFEVLSPEKKQFYVPKVPQIFDKIDADKRIIYIRMPEGLDEV